MSDAPAIRLDESVTGPGIEIFLGAWQNLSPLAGLMVAGLGLVYLAAGKWLFRILVAGIGLAVGLEVGRMLAGHFGLEGVWLPWVVAVAAGAAAWPAWQGLVFLIGGAAVGLTLAEIVQGAFDAGGYYLFALGGGFVAGGLLAVVLIRAAAVAITSAAGAWLTMTGLFAFGHEKVPLVAAAAEATWASLVVFGVLMAIGVAVQLILPSTEDVKRRRLEEAAAQAKADEEAEKQRRYAQYLGR